MNELLDRLAADVHSLRARHRVIVGLAGAPGSGKTTLAQRLVERLGAEAVHVPMDGFHLADVQLSTQGLLGRKGAPETFDAHGYARLLAAVRTERDRVVYAPQFDRTVEQPIAGAIAVTPHHRFVVTEGNYLLLGSGDRDYPGWASARKHMDWVWYLACDDATRVERLVQRHIAYGKSPDAARAWVTAVDEPNAQLVAASAVQATAVIDSSFR